MYFFFARKMNGICGATWIHNLQAYNDLTDLDIRREICTLVVDFILWPTGLEPLQGFCGPSLKWVVLIVGIIISLPGYFLYRTVKKGLDL
ncbi:hypothetical protein MJO29_014929, partial [Puccinia striiformis f. sp. tritici]